MDHIRVRKSALLGAMRKNRTSHRSLFLKAQKVYREDVIAELDEMLKDAREGKNIRVLVSLPTPIDHTEDYDRVIAMLEMCTDTIIELSHGEFEQYVRDKWGWSASTLAVNTSYAHKSR